MVDFTDIVSDILLEGAVTGAPVWLNEVIKQHDNLFKTNITPAELQTAFGSARESRIDQKDIPNIQNFVRLVAFLKFILNQAKPTKPTTLDEFYNKFPGTDSNSVENKETTKVKSFTNKTDWSIAAYDQLLFNTYQDWLGVADQQAKVALETYNNDFILPATQKIITKRTSFFDRIASLKSPTQPFTNLIVDVFKYPEEYISGTRKVTQDFPDIVDDLYITNLFNIGLAAKNFWKVTITNLKTSSPQTQAGNQNQQQTQTNNLINPDQEFYDSLNLFDTYYNSVFIQEGPIGNLVQTARNYAGATKAGIRDAIQQRDPKVFKQVSDKVYKDLTNYMNFITGKPVQYTYVDGDGKDLPNTKPGTTDPKDYTVGAISKMETTEAVELIKALRGIAQYTRKGIGAGQVLKGVGALNSGIRAVN